MPVFGYAGKILRINLSSTGITEASTLDYAEKFLGGRGLAAGIYWDEVSPEVGAFDPDNRLIFALVLIAGLIIPAIYSMIWMIRKLRISLKNFAKPGWNP